MTKIYVKLMAMEELLKFARKVGEEVALKSASKVLDDFSEQAVRKCKEEFGVYQPERAGPNGETFGAWPSLQPKTIANKKVRTGQDVPLLDSGELQQSVESLAPSFLLRLIGTYNEKGKWHEYGTGRIPARPWLRPVLWALKRPFEFALRRKLILDIKAKFPWTKVR